MHKKGEMPKWSTSAHGRFRGRSVMGNDYCIRFPLEKITMMKRGELWSHSSKFMKSEKKILKDFVNDESDKELQKTDKEGIEKEGAQVTMNVGADAAKDVSENVAKKDGKEVGTVEKVLVKEENA